MKKLLVIHTWGMGDMIMATPMLKSLVLNGYEVDLVVFNEINKTILKDNKFLNNIFVLRSKFELIKFYKKYDILVATTGINPKKVKLLNLLIGSKKVFCGYQQKNIHRIDNNINLVETLLTKTDKTPYLYVQNNIKVDNLLKDVNIGFAVGSGVNQKFKRWDKFERLISQTRGNKFVFIGSDELDLEEKYKNLDVTIVKKDIKEVIYLISKLDLLIGNDNGLMHIGYATNINTVTVFGMTNEKETGGYRKNNENVFLDIECRPCFDPATDKVGCKSYDCLANLNVNEVLKICQKYL